MSIMVYEETYCCHSCGNEYKRLGTHWAQSTCNYPKLDDYQKKVLTGLLMGDATIQRQSNYNPRITMGMTNKPFLEWLDTIFDTFTTGVKLRETGEELKEKASEKDGHWGNWNYLNVYTLQSRNLPCLYEFVDWYSTGEKVFPEDIVLSPTTMKMWYVSDGSLTQHYDIDGNKRGRPSVQIAVNNEFHNQDKIQSYFSQLGIEPRFDGRCSVVFGVDDSEMLLDYMGNPPPGFQYKWPNGPTYEEFKATLIE